MLRSAVWWCLIRERIESVSVWPVSCCSYFILVSDYTSIKPSNLVKKAQAVAKKLHELFVSSPTFLTSLSFLSSLIFSKQNNMTLTVFKTSGVLKEPYDGWIWIRDGWFSKKLWKTIQNFSKKTFAEPGNVRIKDFKAHMQLKRTTILTPTESKLWVTSVGWWEGYCSNVLLYFSIRFKHTLTL